MTLKHLKLVNGDELIAKVKESNAAEFYYTLYNPMLLQNLQDTDSGITAIVLYSYSPFSDVTSGIDIAKNNVMTASNVNGNMKEYYNASLEYSVLYGEREMNERILAAAKSLNKFVHQKIEQSIGLTAREEDLDEETYDSITSSNTTIH